MSKATARKRWVVRVAAGFLALSYAVGAPVTAYIEYAHHTLSQRFGYPPAFIYLICAVQLVCSIGVLVRPLASWAAAALTVITLGAIASHLRIGSPQTALAAIVYTAVQVWFALESRAAKVGAADG